MKQLVYEMIHVFEKGEGARKRRKLKEIGNEWRTHKRVAKHKTLK